jgi:outer membrane lipoprotein-sorting protein
MESSERQGRAAGARSTATLILSIAVVTGVLPASGDGGDDEAFLDRVRAAYADVRTLRADFVQVNDWEIITPDAAYEGWIYLTRDGRLRIEYTEPDGHVLVSDGVWVWTYVPESGQVIQSPVSRDQGSASRLFVDFLENRRVVGMARRDSVVEITLEPEEEMALRRLVVGVDPESGLGQTFAWTDREGNTARYAFRDFDTNVRLDPRLFEFVVPEGVELVRLDEGRYGAD